MPGSTSGGRSFGLLERSGARRTINSPSVLTSFEEILHSLSILLLISALSTFKDIPFLEGNKKGAGNPTNSSRYKDGRSLLLSSPY